MYQNRFLHKILYNISLKIVYFNKAYAYTFIDYYRHENY